MGTASQAKPGQTRSYAGTLPVNERVCAGFAPGLHRLWSGSSPNPLPDSIHNFSQAESYSLDRMRLARPFVQGVLGNPAAKAPYATEALRRLIWSCPIAGGDATKFTAWRAAGCSGSPATISR